jgi:signal transduction histidine kinase
MFFTLISYTSASLVIELIAKPAENYRSEFSKAALANLTRTGESGLNLNEAEYLEAMKKIEFAIDSHLPRDESLTPNQKEILAAAQEIQNQIEEVLRPFSHRLWVGVFGEIKSLSGMKLVLEALSKPKFSIMLVLSFQFIVGSFGISLGRSIPDTLILSGFGTLGSAIILFGFRIIYGKRDSVSIFIGSGFLMILGVIPVLTGSLSRPAGTGILAIASGLFIAPAIPLVVFISSLCALIISDKKFAATAAKSVRIQQTILYETIETTQSDLELAGYLHNSLQSQLLRISKQLEQSAIKESNTDAVVHFTELSQILGRTMDDLTLLKREGMGRLTSIIDAWKGIVDIYYEAAESLKISVESENLLIEIIEELITNSIRHGEASKIAISVKQVNEALEVEIAHNGHVMTILGDGLGVKWLANYSLNEPVFNAERNSLSYRFNLK